MLTKFTIENYKCFRAAELTIPPGGLVVLMGLNAAGKTTVLEALDLLAQAVRDPRGMVDAAAARGGLRSVTRWGSNAPICLKAEFASRRGDPVGSSRYVMTMDDFAGRPILIDESLTVLQHVLHPPTPVLRRRGRARELLNDRTGAWDAAGGSSEQPIAATVSQRELYPAANDLREALSSSRVYGSFITAPGWLQLPHERTDGPMALPVAQPVARIAARGGDLVNALWTLLDDDPDRWQRLMTDFQAQFPFVRSMTFPTLPGGRRALRWEHAQGGELYLEQFSEGMVAYISILAAAHAADAPAWTGFNEPEDHLHPALLRRTVAVLEARAERSPVIIATHSDAILDFLTDPMDALFIVKSEADGSSISRPDAAAFDEWMMDHRLSDLRRRGYLEPQGWDE